MEIRMNEYDEKIINGKKSAEELCLQIHNKIEVLEKKYNKVPGLAVIIVGENPASQVYVKNKIKKTKEIGMHSFDYILPEDIGEEKLLELINELNNRQEVNGILVQLPLPTNIDQNKIINAIKPEKDVDGFTTINTGKLAIGQKTFIPCTPKGCLMLIESKIKNISGMKAVIVGSSNIVGKPMANLLLQKNCTVTIVHSKTKNIEDEIKQADILIAALGKPKFIKAEWVKKDIIIIDVGINRIMDNGKIKIVGDVDFENIYKYAKFITPVPGGVGPMTIACLLDNTLEAFIIQNNITEKFNNYG